MPEPGVPDDSELPEAVRTLLHTRIDSYEKLEVLRLLHDDPRPDWSAAQLSTRLRMALPLVEAALEALHSDGFVRHSEGSGARGSYSLANSTLTPATQQLVHEYGARPLLVMQVMTVYAIERVRSGALRAFVEIFAQKKDTGSS